MKKTNPIKEFQLTQIKNLKELTERINHVLFPKEATESDYMSIITQDTASIIAKDLGIDPSELFAWSDQAEVTKVIIPIVEEIIEGEYISSISARLSLTEPTDQSLYFYLQGDNAMIPEVDEESLILATDTTTITDGSLVVILADDNTKPLVRRVKYADDMIKFVSNRINGRNYTTDNAIILGDVVSITMNEDGFRKRLGEE
ncbi:S24 family peptidase [Aerococcaceae bacterium WGS1372]